MEPYYDAELHRFELVSLYNNYGEYMGKVAFGRIYNDKKGRYENDHPFRSSLVSKEEKINGVLYITTRNSVYKVVKR